MDTPAHRRHDISDKVWALLEPHLPGRKGSWGGVARKDNRIFINAVFWIMRTGAPWRDLPPDLGDWSYTHRRFLRWRDKGVWEKLLEILIDTPDYEWLMIDASHCKVHPHAAGAKGGNQDMSRTKGGFNTKLHLAVDAYGMPVRAFILVYFKFFPSLIICSCRSIYTSPRLAMGNSFSKRVYYRRYSSRLLSGRLLDRGDER